MCHPERSLRSEGSPPPRSSIIEKPTLVIKLLEGFFSAMRNQNDIWLFYLISIIKMLNIFGTFLREKSYGFVQENHVFQDFALDYVWHVQSFCL